MEARKLSNPTLFAAPVKTYQPSDQEKIQATALYDLVVKSEYDAAEAMWMKNPRLMFIDVGGKPKTPLKAALFSLDTWMWKPFYEWLQENRPDLVPDFLQQHAEQTQHINFNFMAKLFRACEKYHALYTRNLASCHPAACTTSQHFREPDNTMLMTMNEIYWAQASVLPWHMIREMCRDDKHAWKPDSNFDAKTAPKYGHIDSVGRNNPRNFVDVCSNEFRMDFKRVGKAYFDKLVYVGLVRGGECESGARLVNTKIEHVGYTSPEWRYMVTSQKEALWSYALISSEKFNYDAECFRQLCKVRLADLEQIPKLDEKPRVTPI